MQHWLKVSSLMVFFFFLDRYTKLWALVSEPVSQGLVGWHYVENTAVAFSLPIGGEWLKYALVLIVLGIVWFWVKEVKRGLGDYLMGMLVVGAVGNIVDRFMYGFVIDFIKIWVWPVFNVADSLVVLSVILISVCYNRCVEK